MEVKNCVFCGEEIKLKAIKCKHCGSFLESSSVLNSATDKKKSETLWLSIFALILSIVLCFALLNATYWRGDALMSAFLLSSFSLVLGVVSVQTQEKGKGIAVIAIILSLIPAISYFDMIISSIYRYGFY